MIKSRNTSSTKPSISSDEMALILSELMDKCDSIERKLDLLIDKQDAKLCQCDEESLGDIKIPD